MLIVFYCTIVMVNYMYYHEYGVHGHTYGLCMTLCGCVGVWVYVCGHIGLCVCVCMGACVHLCISTYVYHVWHTCICVCKCACLHVYMYVKLLVYIS